MRIGLAAWHYPQRNLLENLRFFSDHGFTAFSAIAKELCAWIADERRARELAEELEARDVTLTVHHAYPQPDDEAGMASFRDSIRAFAAWQERYRRIAVLSFDVWVDRVGALPMIQWVFDVFQGLGAKIASEDFPLNDKQMLLFRGLTLDDSYGLLIDLGHMNLRLSDTGYPANRFTQNEGEGAPDHAAGDNTPAAFRRALEIKPMKIFEMHIHNNDGKQDVHRSLDVGTADFAGIFREIARLGLDPILTIETVPGWNGYPGEAGDREILRCKALLEQAIADSTK